MATPKTGITTFIVFMEDTLMHSFQKYPVAIILFTTMGVATAQSQIAANNCEACTVSQIVKMVRSCDSGIDYIADFRSNRIYKACSYIDANDGTEA
jgi:hypothetical protein